MIFQSITQAAWKTENYVFPTGVQLMTFWLLVQILYYYYVRYRRLVGVHGSKLIFLLGGQLVTNGKILVAGS